MSGSATCRWCQRPIVWAKTARGANLAVDPNPRRNGTHVIVATGVQDGKVVFAVRHARSDDPPEVRRACHFETCPRRSGREDPGEPPSGEEEP